MPKNSKIAAVDDVTTTSATNGATKLDDLDTKIISLLVSGKENKDIADDLNVPLSTIQRRTRRLFSNNTVQNRVEPNYRHLGFSKGVVHLYINNVDAMTVSRKLASISGVISVSIHIGNSDIVGDIIYKNSMEVLELLAKCKRIEGVTKVIWSEEVYRLPIELSEQKFTSYLRKE